MIRHMGYEYKAKLNVSVDITVTGRNEDDAGDNAVQYIERLLEEVGAKAEAEVLEMERGDELLDITEDDES